MFVVRSFKIVLDIIYHILHKYKISEDDIIPIYKEELFMEIFDIISNNKIIMKNNIFNDTNFVKINNSF